MTQAAHDYIGLKDLVGCGSVTVTPEMETAYNVIKSLNNIGLERSFLSVASTLNDFYKSRIQEDAEERRKCYKTVSAFAAVVLKTFGNDNSQNHTLDNFSNTLNLAGLYYTGSRVSQKFAIFYDEARAVIRASKNQKQPAAPAAPARTHGFIVTGVCPN